MPDDWQNLYKQFNGGMSSGQTGSVGTSSGSTQGSSSQGSQQQSTNSSQNQATAGSQNWGMSNGQNTATSTGQNTSLSNSQNTSTGRSQSVSTDTDKLMLDAYGKLMPQLQGMLGQPVNGVDPSTNYADAFRQAMGGFTDIGGSLNSQQGVLAGANQLQQSQQQRLQELYGKDFNYNDVAQQIPDASDQTRKAVEDALYAKSTSRLDPRFQQSQSDLDSRLAAQGITQGSEAYNREMMNLARERTDAYEGARNSAVSMSTDEMAKQFGMGLSARQQGVGEANTLRQMPTTEALAAGQLGSQAAGATAGLANAQTGQQAAAGAIANSNTQNATAQAGQKFSQQQTAMDNMLKYFQSLRSGGQASLSSSTTDAQGTSTGTSQGTTNSNSQGTTASSNYGDSNSQSTGNSTGQSTGSSYGSSQNSGSNVSSNQSFGVNNAMNYGQSFNLPNFLNIGANSAGVAGSPDIAGLTNSNYANQVSGNNSQNAGIASLASAAMMATGV